MRNPAFGPCSRHWSKLVTSVIIPSLGLDFGGQSRTFATRSNVGRLDGTFSTWSEIIVAAFAQCGIPEDVVIAVASAIDPEDGSAVLTNCPELGVLHPGDFVRQGCKNAILVHDLRAKDEEVPFADLELIVPGRAVPGIRKTVATISSGVGSKDTESGHTVWQPVGRRQRKILAALQRRYRDTQMLFSVEDLIGGQHLHKLYQAMIDIGDVPTEGLRWKLGQLLAMGNDLGPTMTAAALAGDSFARRFMKIFGSILGQYLRTLCLTVEGGARGGIVLTGGGLPLEVLIYLRDHTPMMKFWRGGRTHNEWISQIPLELSTDPFLGAKGALRMAYDLAA